MNLRATKQGQDKTDRLIRAGVLTYVFALCLIAAFSIAFHFITDNIVQQQQNTARVVNLSGRQRMLAQKIARLSLERAAHAGFRPDAETDRVLVETIAAMRAAHQTMLQGLAAGGPGPLSSPAVHRVYEEEPVHLSQQVSEFLGHASSLAARPAGAVSMQDGELAAMETAVQAPLLDGLNGAVQAITDASEASIRHLRHVLAWLTVLMLVILLGEALLLYRPLFHRLKDATRDLVVAGRTDPLTGCLNRRAFLQASQEMLTEAWASGQKLAVMMVDIDRFKAVNDQYGHPAGDTVINAVVAAILGCTREGNVVCRMGGEEFAVLLAGSSLSGAAKAAETLRAAVEQTVVTLEPVELGLALRVTVSVGVAMLMPGDDTVFHGLQRADRALYLAKQAGRNRVELEGVGGEGDAASRDFERVTKEAAGYESVLRLVP